MKTKPTQRATKALKKPAAPALSQYFLRLFVAGATGRSHQAIQRVQLMCEAELKGRCKLEVIDIYQQPGLARINQIVATPTLVIALPRPMRRLIGSLTNLRDLVIELDLSETTKNAL